MLESMSARFETKSILIFLLTLLAGVGGMAQEKSSPSDGARGISALKSIERGLGYLERTQGDDGGWDAPAEGDVAATSLALLAYLGAGNTDKAGPHKAIVGKAIRFLVANGEKGRTRPPVAFPDQFLAAHAVSEAYALTKTEALVAPATRLFDRVLVEQRSDGAWGAHGRAAGGNAISTAWALMALKSLHISGCLKDERLERARVAMEKGSAYLISMTDAETGRVGFSVAGELPVRPTTAADRFPPRYTEEVTGAAMFARVLCGARPKESPTLMKGAALLAQKTARFEPNAVNQLHWYFGGLAAYQVGGEPWKVWAKAIREQIGQTQTIEGNASGTWPRLGPWTESAGPVIATSLCTMCLETAFRYARVFK